MANNGAGPDIVDDLRAQLPRGLSDKIDTITILSDPYYLRVVATFTTEDRRRFVCILGRDDHVLPDLFLAKLCAEV